MQRGVRKALKYFQVGLNISFTFFIILALVLMTTTSVLAKHNPKVSIDPVSAYETIEQEMNITINNFGSKDPITVLLVNGDLTIVNVTEIPGWDVAMTPTGIRWENGSVEGNVVNALFQFRAKMNKVDANQTKTVTVSSLDSKNTQQNSTKDVAVVNDDIPPTLTNASPTLNNLLKPTAFANISLVADDPQTGIENVTFAYQNCEGLNGANDVNLQPASASTTLLQKQGNTSHYASLVNLSTFKNGDKLCFTYTATDKGGGTSTITGNVTFDGLPPTVILTAPVVGGLISGKDALSFNFSDNLAATGTCTVFTNNTNVTSLDVGIGTNTIKAENATEGLQNWNVECSDSPGNKASSATQLYKLDKSGPVISFLNLPSYIIRGNLFSLIANITDLSSVKTAQSNYTSLTLGTTTITVNGTNASSLYTASLPTNINTTPEVYTFDWTALDQFDYQSNISVTLPVVYGYKIEIDESATKTTFGKNPTLSGKITFDNGSLIPERNLSFYFPGGAALVNINNQTGAFSYDYPAPNGTGTFNLSVNVTAQNNVTYSKTAELVVQPVHNDNTDGTNSGSGRSSRSGGGSSGGAGGGPGGAGAGGAGSSGASGGSAGSSGGASSGSSSGSSSSGSSAGASGGTGGAAGGAGGTGVGKATGFLTQTPFKYSQLVWTLLVLMIIIGSLLYASRDKSLKIVMKKKGETKEREGQEYRKEEKKIVHQSSLSLEEYLKNRLR